ncbi:MAG: ATP-binding protein, partial [Bacteroidota bacterium]
KGDEYSPAVFDHQKQLVDNYLMVEIRDSGIGIRKDELDKVFNPYYQVKSSSSLHSIGTGLGLSLVSGIVGLHQGSVAVDSSLGQGSVFTIKLPFGQRHFTEEQLISNFKNSEYIGHYLEQRKPLPELAPQPDAYLRQLEEKSRKFSILVVEDNPDLRSYLSAALRKHFVIFEATNGQDGFDLALEETPDLIVSDIMMPVLDGISMVKKLKSHELVSYIP